MRLLTGSVETTAQAHEPWSLDDTLVQWYFRAPTRTTAWTLAIEDEVTLVGEVVLNDYDVNVRATCASSSGPPGVTGGLGTEAVALTTSYGIRDPGLTRITLEVLDTNPRGRRVYEKVGYRPTGHRDRCRARRAGHRRPRHVGRRRHRPGTRREERAAADVGRGAPPAQPVAVLVVVSALVTTCAVFAPLFVRTFEQGLLQAGLQQRDVADTTVVVRAARTQCRTPPSAPTTCARSCPPRRPPGGSTTASA